MYGSLVNSLVDVSLARPIRIQPRTESGEALTKGPVRILAFQGQLEECTDAAATFSVHLLCVHMDDLDLEVVGEWIDHRGTVIVPLTGILGMGTVGNRGLHDSG